MRFDALAIIGLLFLAWIVMALGERAQCDNRLAHSGASLFTTFDVIDDHCTRLSFFPFTRPR